MATTLSSTTKQRPKSPAFLKINPVAVTGAAGIERVFIKPKREKIGLHCFQPVRFLGKGSFGEVFLMLQKSTHEYVAIKSVSKKLIRQKKLERYIYAERNILASMHHPFIVSLLGSFQTCEKLFLVMEFCSGGDLSHLLRSEYRFTEERALQYLAEILLAIEELHKNDIIYRDLKPENVLLDSEGHVKLTDFGLSKQGLKDEEITSSFCGTISYLAPEVLQKAGYTKTVDWYLLGVIFYEMLVGVPPYYSKNQEELFTNIKIGHLRIPRFISKTAIDLIQKLLCRNPHNRLGARGAQEIKSHAFFKSIKWDAVLARKQKMMPIEPATPKLISPPDIAEIAGGVEEEYHFKKWSFVSKT